MKKNITLILLAAVFATTAAAQPQKGDHIVSAGLSANIMFPTNTQATTTAGKEETHLSNYILGLKLMDTYFLTRNIGVGASVGYDRMHREQSASNEMAELSVKNEQTGRSLTAGAHIAYYGRVLPRLCFTATCGFDYKDENTTIKGKVSSGGNYYERREDISGEGYMFSLTPGLACFPTDRLVVSVSAGRLECSSRHNSGHSQSSELKGEINHFNLNLNTLAISVGLRF